MFLIFVKLLMAAIGLVFAPLAPLVALSAAVVFWLSSWVYKYQLMFVYITKVETGGVSCPCLRILCRMGTENVMVQRLWNVVINRLLFCVILMQALMILSAYSLKDLSVYMYTDSHACSYWPAIYVQISFLAHDYTSDPHRHCFQSVYQPRVQQ
jgi:hypothetical protein